MRCRFLTLCSIILSCHLTAQDKSNENFSLEPEDISAARRGYESAKALLEKTDPGATIQFDATTGAITVKSGKDNRAISNDFITLVGGSIITTNQPAVNGNVTFGSSVNVITSSSSFSTFFKADSAYAKSLPIRHFILSELQMSQFFSNSSPQPEPLNFYGLSESKLYLIVQIKNIGSRNASGILYFPFFRRFFSISINLDPDMPDFSTYVVPLGIRDREDFEDISDVNKILDALVWDELFTGPTIEEFVKNPEEYIKKDQNEESLVSTIDDNQEDTGFFPIFRSLE